MSRGINKVIIIGNLGNDPDTRYTASGDAVTNLSIATDEGYKNKEGQQVDKVEWHRVVMFGKLAEIAQQYLKKGSKVYIEGKLQTRKWQDNAGVDKYTTEIVVDSFNGQMQMLDGKPDQGQQGQKAYYPNPQAQQQSTQFQRPAQQTPGQAARVKTEAQIDAEGFDTSIPF